MGNLDTHSLTWRAVNDWLIERRQYAVDSLISGGAADDKLRGEIRLIDDLISDSRPEPPKEPPQDPDY
jgi:hypothetical protein